MAKHIIRCRAKLLDADCYDGSPTTRQFGEDGGPMSQDGTWNGATIVCDACYTRLMPFTRSGRAELDELPGAIEVYRANLAHVRGCSAAGLMDAKRGASEEVAAAAARGGAGQPLHVSASAAVAMVDRELKRRGGEGVASAISSATDER